MLGPAGKETFFMDIFFSTDHVLHNPEKELHRGDMIAPHEGPYRMDLLVQGLNQAGFKTLLEPGQPDLSALSVVHSEAYLQFLQTAWDRWQAAGYGGDVIGIGHPRGLRRETPPVDIDGATGYFSAASDTVITKTSWQAALAGVKCTLSAAQAVQSGAGSAFSLSRPPGHHAGRDYLCGYCFLNNAAIAAQFFRDAGAQRVAVVDVDFHHGNGTQDIFYDRGDVLFTSLHGDPDHHYPYFWGHQDERGVGAGEGANINYPLRAGTDFGQWHDALKSALNDVSKFGADVLIVSLGVDTFENDPLSSFTIRTEDYYTYGQTLAGLDLPIVFVMEGGYGVPDVGTNVAGVLNGFLNA